MILKLMYDSRKIFDNGLLKLASICPEVLCGGTHNQTSNNALLTYIFRRSSKKYNAISTI